MVLLGFGIAVLKLSTCGCMRTELRFTTSSHRYEIRPSRTLVIGTAGTSHLGESPISAGGYLGSPTPCGGLDELGQSPRPAHEMHGDFTATSRCRQDLHSAAWADVQPV